MSERSLEPRFWERKTLAQMSDAEWEALCDGCGKCCLNKVIDDDTDDLYFTDIACKLLNTKTCQCRRYEKRFEYVKNLFEGIGFSGRELDLRTRLFVVYQSTHLGMRLPDSGLDADDEIIRLHEFFTRSAS